MDLSNGDQFISRISVSVSANPPLGKPGKLWRRRKLAAVF
jgi:hypothetical protein